MLLPTYREVPYAFRVSIARFYLPREQGEGKERGREKTEPAGMTNYFNLTNAGN